MESVLNKESVLKQEDAIYYVSTGDIISFINKNSYMEWNDICSFTQKNGLVNETGKCFLVRGGGYYDNELDEWIEAFFDVHPWINKMMIVFDD